MSSRTPSSSPIRSVRTSLTGSSTLRTRRSKKRRVLRRSMMRLSNSEWDEHGDRREGITLSGGQRQRIALARAVLMNPPIFTWMTPSPRWISRQKSGFWRIGEIPQGKNQHPYHHRIAPLRRADRIVVLEEGRVAETETTILSSPGRNLCRPLLQRQWEEELAKE